MSYLLEFWHSIVAVYGAVDWVTLGIIVAIILIAGAIMQGFEAIVTTTVVALILFAAAFYVRSILGNGKDAGAVAASQWHGFMGMTMQTLLVYAITFAIGIGIIHAIRQIVVDR